MNIFHIEIGAKIFCILIIVFLFFFNMRTFKKDCIANIFLYIFSFLAVFLSIFKDILINEETIQFTNIALGIFYFLSAFFWFGYVFGKEKCKKEMTLKITRVITSFVFGVISYCFINYYANLSTYILTFLVIVGFCVYQYNKIIVDELTGLYNRYGMDAEVEKQLRQYRRKNTDSFYVIACDLDNFKHINDEWGHPEGDRALVLIAEALTKVGKRFSSGVFRIGGDEFVIITNTSEEGLATEVANAVEDELDNVDFRDDFDIDMSIGYAHYDGTTPIKELLKKADKKMYEAKKKRK